MKKENIYKIIIIIILLALFSLIGYYGFNNSRIIINSIDINYDKEISLCLDKDNCDLLSSYSYPTINIDTKSRKIKKIVNNYNKEANDLYSKVINSNLDSNDCINLKDKYKYKYITNINYYTYYDDKVVSITRKLFVKDLCSDKIIENETSISVYDTNTSKLLSNEEILKLYNFKEEDVVTKITENININNDISSDELTIEDIYLNGKLNYNIYFDEDGNMVLEYSSSKTKEKHNIIMTKIGE